MIWFSALIESLPRLQVIEVFDENMAIIIFQAWILFSRVRSSFAIRLMAENQVEK